MRWGSLPVFTQVSSKSQYEHTNLFSLCQVGYYIIFLPINKPLHKGRFQAFDQGGGGLAFAANHGFGFKIL